MYNLLRYSSVLLVLLSNFKTLTGLPYEVQPVPVEQPQAQPSAPLPVPLNDAASISDVAPRSTSLNATDTHPVARSALESATNATAEAVVPRSLPVADVPAPVQAPAQALPVVPTSSPALAERSAFNLPVQAAVAPQAVPNPSAPQVALRSGLENTPSAASNVSSVETRSLNVSSAEVAPRAANESQGGLVANAPPAPVNNATSPPSSGFVPSFLRNYGLRLKRGEEALGASNESVVSVRSSLELSPPASNGPAAALAAPAGEPELKSGLVEADSGNSKQVAVSTAEVGLRSGLDQSPAAGNIESAVPGARVAVESAVAEVNLAPALPSVRSGLEASLNQELPPSPSSANIPYVNVYPVGKVYYV